MALAAYVIAHLRSPLHAEAPGEDSRRPASADNAVLKDRCTNLYQAICKKRGESRDPTGHVRPDVTSERQVLDLYQVLLDQHPEWSVEQLDEELVSQVYTPKRKKRLEDTFFWVLNEMQKYIDSQPDADFTHREKRMLINRIRKVQLQLPPPANVYADEPDLFTKTDIYYERLADGTLRLRVGGAYVHGTSSWFNMVFTFAHELAHAIDPCELRTSRVFLPAYDRISACFLYKGHVATPSTRSECGENDQLSETFADWMAVQVSARALHRFAVEFDHTQLLQAATNAVRDLCDEGVDFTASDDSLHPNSEIRIEKIFGRNPMVRQLLGCAPVPNRLPYCNFEWVVPTSEGTHP